MCFVFIIYECPYSVSRLSLIPTILHIGVKAGGDRQELHEAIRVHSMAAGAVVKGEGKPNDLMERFCRHAHAAQPKVPRAQHVRWWVDSTFRFKLRASHTDSANGSYRKAVVAI